MFKAEDRERVSANLVAKAKADVEPAHGRGFDQLPSVVLEAFAGSFACKISAQALRSALAVTANALLNQTINQPEIVEPLRSMLAEICGPVLA